VRTRTRVLVLVAVVLVMAWPALRRPPTDGFPMSTYPMFASDRGATSTIATAVGVTEVGTVVRLTPEVLAGSDEPMQAISTAGAAIRDGWSDQWCVQVADRVDDKEIVTIEVRRETHDIVEFFTDDAAALDVDLVTSCDV
jgi:hypothetical protein